MLFLYDMVKPDTKYVMPDEKYADLVTLMAGIKELDIKYQKEIIHDILQEMSHNNQSNTPFYYDLLFTLKDIEDSIANNQKIPTLSHIPDDFVTMYLSVYFKYRRMYYEALKKNRKNAIETSDQKLLAESNELIDAYALLPVLRKGDKIKVNIPASFVADWLVEWADATVIGDTLYGTLLRVPSLAGVVEYDPRFDKQITHSEYYMIDFSYPSVWVEVV